MNQPLVIALLSALLLWPAGCGGDAEESDGASASESAEDSDEDSDKYTIGGRTRPAWIETLQLVTESLSLTTSEPDLRRASNLALAASELAAEHPHLLGYAELTLAFAELRRGKIENFERLMVRGLGRVPADAKHTELAIMAAEQSVRRGRLDPSRVVLGLWVRRLEEAGETKLAKQVEDKAREHLERVRGKRTEEKVKLEKPPEDFPIVLPN
jgi:hypothetical protein